MGKTIIITRLYARLLVAAVSTTLALMPAAEAASPAKPTQKIKKAKAKPKSAAGKSKAQKYATREGKPAAKAKKSAARGKKAAAKVGNTLAGRNPGLSRAVTHPALPENSSVQQSLAAATDTATSDASQACVSEGRVFLRARCDDTTADSGHGVSLAQTR